MKSFIKHIIEDFNFNSVNQSNTAADRVINTINLQTETVDLGLPSGTLWCKYNLGVNSNKLKTPKDWYGDYYAWGETATKPAYTWNNYKFEKKLTKYNRNDNIDELQLEDDAVYQKTHIWGLGFKMPTYEQFEELLKYTTNKWVENYQDIIGLNGVLFKGQNNKELFIPASGWYVDNKIKNSGSNYYLWSSTLDTSWPGQAYHLRYSQFINIPQNITSGVRYYGCTIRPVINYE